MVMLQVPTAQDAPTLISQREGQWLVQETWHIQLLRHEVIAYLGAFNLEPELIGDIKLIVSELATNAIVHSQWAMADVAIDCHGGWIGIQVEDNGVGLPFEVLDRLASNTPVDDGAGSGRGCYIVAELAKLRCGHLWLRTGCGGTLICLILPIPPGIDPE